MAGLEVLGAVGASLQLVKVAETCLSIVVEVRQIPTLAREQNDAHLGLLFQALKFESWCAALGIQDILENAQNRHHPDDPITSHQVLLKSTVGSKLRWENPKLEALTLTALGNMKDKLSDATNIISLYAEGPSPMQQQNLTDEAMQAPTNKISSRWSKFMRKELKPSLPPMVNSSTTDFQSQTGAVSNGGSSIVRRAKWVSTDKGRVEKLLNSIRETNDLLAALTNPAIQAQIDRKTDMTVLDIVDLDTLAGAESRPDLTAMARIKHWQKREQRNNQSEDSASAYSFTTISGPNQTSARVHTYQVRDFKRGALPHGDYRTLAVLENKQVMVEWKHYNRDHPIRLEQTLRLGHLAGLLNRDNLFEKFMALPCKGLVDDTDNSRIGVVFSIEAPAASRLGSLHALIHDIPVPVPLGQRFDLAKSLVTAIHHLHSVDWLHKSIQSDNVMCCWAAGSEPQLPPLSSRGKLPDIQENIHEGSSIDAGAINTSEAGPRPLPPFHLVGWDLSRPDHPLELSETLSISTAGFQSRRDTIRLYSHPALHAKSELEKRQRYCAQFDIYSLGLVLLEIGLWRTLKMLREECENDHDFRVKVCTKFCDKLLYRMGEVYWRVVQRCLKNDFDDQSGEGASVSEGGFSLQVAFERLVVSELDRCCA